MLSARTRILHKELWLADGAAAQHHVQLSYAHRLRAGHHPYLVYIILHKPLVLVEIHIFNSSNCIFLTLWLLEILAKHSQDHQVTEDCSYQLTMELHLMAIF
jgi:hypothetical protein